MCVFPKLLCIEENGQYYKYFLFYLYLFICLFRVDELSESAHSSSDENSNKVRKVSYQNNKK